MENSSILVFQNKICCLDYFVCNSFGHYDTRITEIRLPFNFIDSIPYEVSSYYDYTDAAKSIVNSQTDFYFSFCIIEDSRYSRKKRKNILNYLKKKDNLEDIRVGLCPHDYTIFPDSMIKTLVCEEEYLQNEKCKELLLDFYNSSKKYVSLYQNMITSVINKIK